MGMLVSRAQTIFLVEVRQEEMVGGEVKKKVAVMNFVDLAGSERIGKTGTTAGRVKEITASANRLSVLLNVIENLAYNIADK